MKKLPSIYKNTVHVQNNLNTFYSKHDQNLIEVLEEVPSKKNYSHLPVRETLKKVFENPMYSYMKTVRVGMHGNVFETRIIREDQGRLLTIDNEFIEISEIESLYIIS